MTMQVQIIAHRIGDGRADFASLVLSVLRLGFRFLRLFLGLPHFALGEVAFMEAHFAGMGRLDIDAPALLLARLHEIPLRELLAAFEDHDFAPFGREIGVAPLGDFRVLCGPEVLRVLEVTLLAEQVAHDLVLERG